MFSTSTLSQPTLENVVFLIQQLTNTVSYGFNDIRTTLNTVVEENRILKAKIETLQADVNILKEEAKALKSSNSFINPDASIAIATTSGLFATNFYPERKKPAPRAKNTRSGRTDRSAPFSWKHFRKLIDEVRGSEHEQLNDDLFHACKLNVSSHLVKAVIDDTKRQYGISSETAWAGIPGDAQLYAIESLETKAAPYIPLRACVGSWGQACFLSITGATSVDRARCKAQVVSQVVEASIDEPRMTVTESVHWNNVEEELAFNIDISAERTVTGHPKQLLGKRLADKGKIALFAFNDKLIAYVGKHKASAKRKKATPEEEENDQNEEEYDE
ncbi:hypothetical protein RMCBS344292_06053 [Rhizopus microsporus]|nr:hypothetical protein RMCBS344292_06053 [Rhizopus microsporus]